MRKSIPWMEREDQLILENVALVKSKKWKLISNLLKEHGFEKKETECRQRYINHLAPSLDRNKNISADQLELFYQKYEEYGPKWTLIQRFLPNKSQVQLKNIFYGNIRCFLKKIIKYYTNKTAVFVNKLDTFILQNIYSGKRNFRGLLCLKQDIKKMNYKFDEDLCFQLIKARQQTYKDMLKILFDQNQAKKSKHYQYFTKINNNDFFNSPQIKQTILNGPENKNQSVHKNQQQNQVKEEQDQLINAASEIPFKIHEDIEPVLNECQLNYWNANQIPYFNQPLMGIETNQGHMMFYQASLGNYYATLMQSAEMKGPFYYKVDF